MALKQITQKIHLLEEEADLYESINAAVVHLGTQNTNSSEPQSYPCVVVYHASYAGGSDDLDMDFVYPRNFGKEEVREIQLYIPSQIVNVMSTHVIKTILMGLKLERYVEHVNHFVIIVDPSEEEFVSKELRACHIPVGTSLANMRIK